MWWEWSWLPAAVIDFVSKRFIWICIYSKCVRKLPANNCDAFFFFSLSNVAENDWECNVSIVSISGKMFECSVSIYFLFLAWSNCECNCFMNNFVESKENWVCWAVVCVCVSCTQIMMPNEFRKYISLQREKLYEAIATTTFSIILRVNIEACHFDKFIWWRTEIPN